MKKLLITLSIAGLGLSACTTAPSKNLSDNYGNAVNAAKSTQVINPNAVPGAPAMNAARSAAAVERYVNDEVKQPKDVSTINSDVD